MFIYHKPTINLIAAVAVDGSIGSNGKLLWNIPKDLEYYKARTWNNVIIMGYETYKTLPKVALKGRKTVVILKSDEFKKEMKEGKPFYVRFAFSIEDGLIVAKEEANFSGSDIYIAGGASIYKQMIQYCEYAFITWVDKKYRKKADKFFPIKDFFTTFDLISESVWHDKKVKKRPAYKFTTYKKRKL